MSSALVSLKRRWWLAVGLSLVLVAVAFLWLWAAWGVRPAAVWAVLASPTAAYELALLRRNLPANHAPAASVLFSGLGLANWVTMARGLLLAVLAGFLLLPRPVSAFAWAPAILYTLAIAADLLDGALARLTGRVTALGATLDIEFDGLGVLIASLLVVRYGQLPWPYLTVGLARYLFVAGLWWLKRQGRPTHDLPPSTLRRIAAGTQMAFISVILWPLFGPPATTVAGACFAVPFLAGFTRDWLVVSGAVVPTGAGYRWLAQGYAWGVRWLPLSLRVGAAALAGIFLAPALWRATSAGLAGLTGGLALLAGGLLALGAVTRLAALGLLAATCADLALRSYQPYHGVLLTTTIGLVTLGGGAYALWPADDALFERRADRGG